MNSSAPTSSQLTVERVHAALEGQPEGVTALLEAVLPVVQARVARALLRRSESRGRDIGDEVADLTQEVFVALFADDAKALRAWEPTRGMSLANFVGLLAERRVATILRAKSRNPWSEEPAGDALETSGTPPSQSPDRAVSSKELLERLLEELRASLSPRGLELFYRLYVYEQSPEQVCAETGLSADAVYQWRRRLRKAAQQARAKLSADRPRSQSGQGAA